VDWDKVKGISLIVLVIAGGMMVGFSITWSLYVVIANG